MSVVAHEDCRHERLRLLPRLLDRRQPAAAQALRRQRRLGRVLRHHHLRADLDGGGNTEEIRFPDRGFRGFTLRLFDVERGEWSIFWASSRTGRLEPPVVGSFAGGRGDFYGDDTHEGEPIKVHFTWSGITETTARWEQEFSADGGQTWESNWVMEFTRA